MNDPHPVSGDVVSRAEIVTPAPHSQPLARAVGHFLFSLPEAIPATRPEISLDDCEGAFAHRFGVAVIYSARVFQYVLSPSGDLGAVIKLFLRWFIFLIGLIVIFGIPGLMAAQFTASISSLLLAASKDLFQSVLYIVGSAAMIAGAVAAGLYWIRRRANFQRDKRRR